ncbi:uncharacterized protein F4812DRAFT_408934 [Daldinia caldariorum]|uniref:uncharacterized protein n=1 Tax=Daldinia caldariorum TaxID=326644 RepID=UPI00200786BA|nr:uncharacterized protein F4812DRAFT_408934 [Daldinia caldariorum]KAI1472447.1 hypothetical protein F4812DRAFT_408934 [Daldinia caldariorum]
MYFIAVFFFSWFLVFHAQLLPYPTRTTAGEFVESEDVMSIYPRETLLLREESPTLSFPMTRTAQGLNRASLPPCYL